MANPAKAKHAQWFFKTGTGEYGEGDLFLGLTNPQVRDITKELKHRVELADLAELIVDPYFQPTLELAKLLLTDQEDLMHKAVGWLLKEVGKQDQATLEKFLQTHENNMPRTMLRHAIEKLSEEKRQFYLAKN